MTIRRTATLLATLFVAAAVVASCGRRGAPLTPYEAGIEARRDAEREGRPLPPEPQKPVADRPFILDALID